MLPRVLNIIFADKTDVIKRGIQQAKRTGPLRDVEYITMPECTHE